MIIEYKPIITNRNLIILLPYSYLIVSIIFSDTLEKKQCNEGKFSTILPVYMSAGIVFVMMVSAFLNFMTYEKQEWHASADSIKRIENIDKIYCLGSTEKYWHYLKTSGLKKDILINIKEEGIKLISKPKEGKISILWDAWNAYRYVTLKRALTLDNQVFFRSAKIKRSGFLH